jgi:hypothetical protein
MAATKMKDYNMPDCTLIARTGSGRNARRMNTACLPAKIYNQRTTVSLHLVSEAASVPRQTVSNAIHEASRTMSSGAKLWS